MLPNKTWFLLLITLTTVTAQTFQYSRGWTNGKRDGHKAEELRELPGNLERILSPCQITKLKYILEGRPINERLFGPCKYFDDEENQPKRYKPDRNQEPPFEVFQ